MRLLNLHPMPWRSCRCCGGTGKVPDARKIGAIVREERLKIGRSLRSVAREAGCSAAHLSDLELGKREWTGPAALRVLDTLDIW